MDNATLSSPERMGPPSCTVTYLERKKRKRANSNQADSDSDASFVSKPTATSPMKNTPSPKKKSKEKAPVSKGPKQVDVSLPGPSPKRVRRDSEEVASAKPKKATHIKSVSSVSSLNRVLQQVADSPTVGKKPALATTKPLSKAKSVPATDDGDFDDAASVAESVVSTKVRRNEGERIQYFENQSECGKIEPHSVECLRCTKLVNLGRKQTYAVRPWEIHRARCDQRPPVTIPSTPAPTQKTTGNAEPETTVATPSVVEPSPARRQTEDERRAALESDPRASAVEANRLKCRRCEKWISLSDDQPYIAGNWIKHKAICVNAIPSNRVAAAKRKLVLVNDAQAKSFETRKVGCAFCGEQVELQGEGDFNLTSWEEHKTVCNKHSPPPRSESLNSVPFPSRFVRPPPSSASSSTERTLIASEPVVPSSSKGVKRAREDTGVADEEERATVRPRSNSYIPPQKEAPSPLGWLLLPFQAFARGFKESLKNGS